VANLSYELPFGKKSKVWSSNSLLAINSTRCDHEFWIAFHSICGRRSDRDATSDNAARPNLISGISLKPPNGSTPNLWFNPLAFGPPVPGFRGTAGRNILSGPDFKSVDFSVVKEFKFSENRKLQFRAEVFNLLNRANFDLPANADDGEQLLPSALPALSRASIQPAGYSALTAMRERFSSP